MVLHDRTHHSNLIQSIKSFVFVLPTASISLESRLASFFDQGRSTSSASNPPVYTPQLPASLAAAKLSSKQVTTTAAIEEDGSTTPLDDEAPTTPVQDEVSLSSPPPPPKSAQRSTPPKKENPIDFLSRLISQTQKGAAGAGGPTKTGAASFLDSLTMLNTSSGSLKKPESPGGSVSSSQQAWNDWAANSSSLTASSSISSSSNINSSLHQPSSPSMPAYAPSRIGGTSVGNSLPTSPIQFPSTPQPVPPPIPLPVPPPPMALKLNLNMPPPPPPPFLTSPVPPPNFSSPPPPIFHQTSPGQKENWPEVVGGGSDVPTIPNDKLDPGLPAAARLADPDAMEIVSDEDETSLGINSSNLALTSIGGGDAKTEFANKLRQKTLAGPNVVGGLTEDGLKSHVFVPNPERPNLMTLTVPEDLDEQDMIDRDTVVEDDKRRKSTSSRKSRSRTRSRSRSREKERSHKHKKKKKHKRTHSDDEDFRLLDDGKSSSHGVGSVVKKVGSRSGRDSRDGKGDKYEEEKRYDKYEERKYDRYEDKGYRSDHKSYKSSHKGESGGGMHRDSKDGVEAYTQAYRDALFQQYSARFNPFPGAPGSLPPPAPDPRRYNKY